MRKKGLVAFGLAAVMTASALTGCGGASDKKDSGKKEAKGTVYYLNFKPEADAQWQELAKLYTDKTGAEKEADLWITDLQLRENIRKKHKEGQTSWKKKEQVYLKMD